MSFASDPDLLVLHGVRLKGFAEAPAVADLVGLDVDDVVKRLEEAGEGGLVKHRSGKVSGWTLTTAGRAEGERLLAEELDEADARDLVNHAYREFLVLNPDLLEVCTEWQMRDVDGTPTINDHADPVHDAAVIERLRGLDSAVEPVTSALAGALDRFRGYRERLAHALARVLAGENDWFTKPTIDSYHTVWFELHENLLATLGIVRGSEIPPVEET